MRVLLDHLIRETYKIVEQLEELRLEMHNRPRQMRGRVTSNRTTPKVKAQILKIHAVDPNLPQHEIARIVNVQPGRVSEIIAGKRT